MPIGPWELGIVLLIVIVIFGAGKLATVGSALGKSVREFKTATKEEMDKEDAADAAESKAEPRLATKDEVVR
jgi:sec-independent protein translocase protein TatA